MGTYGYLLILMLQMGPNGSLKGPHALLWILMVPYGSLCVLMFPYGLL